MKTLLLLGVLTLCGCAAVAHTPQMLPVSELSKMPRSIYRVQEGDVLDIRFRFTPELNDVQMVRLDGRISLTYLPDLRVADMTIDQMRAALAARYAPILHNPVITVIVQSSSASRVFIGGEVQSPGEFGFTGRGTLSQYLTKAGGLKDSGAGGDILLIRRGPDFAPYMSVLNAAAVFSGRNPGQDIDLMPYDVIYVPPTRIAQVDRLSDQYIRQIVPISFNYLF